MQLVQLQHCTGFATIPRSGIVYKRKIQRGNTNILNNMCFELENLHNFLHKRYF